MRKKKSVFMFLLMISLIFSLCTGSVYAQTKNEVTLNFEGGIIHDGYVEYSNIGKLQLFKGDELIVNISNNMTIDLNEADYKLVIQEIPVEDTGSVVVPAPVKLNINGWYYPMTTIVGETKSTFKLDSSKFSGTLDVKLVRIGVAINTTVKNIYNDISSKGVIDLTNGQEHVIDFSKTDELTEGLKSFADLDKTLYYQVFNGSLLVTDDASVAVIKIVGNRSENKAILTAENVGTKKSEVFKGFHMQFTGSALDYDDFDGDIASGGIVRETRYDYYTRCTYEFTFQYVKEEVSPKEYKFTEGANQIYTIDESKNAIFRINADFSLFDGKLYIDGTLIDAKNYKAESGSTVITLNKEYVDTLSIGEHTIKVEFSDGGFATTKFEVKAKQVNTEKTEDITNPQTGDNIGTYIILSIISVLGITATVVIDNKKKREN